LAQRDTVNFTPQHQPRYRLDDLTLIRGIGRVALSARASQTEQEQLMAAPGTAGRDQRVNQLKRQAQLDAL
jgi:predicted flap endonuclease-1-like 5' DNA nuclease